MSDNRKTWRERIVRPLLSRRVLAAGDDPTDLIFRYRGAPPQASWTDRKHLVLRVDALSRIELLLTIYAGIHIILDTPDTTALTPSPGPPIPDAPA